MCGAERIYANSQAESNGHYGLAEQPTATKYRERLLVHTNSAYGNTEQFSILFIIRY
jgi:hypothetical protein